MTDLTPSETEQLRLMLLGLSIREAGRYGNRSHRTVANHRNSIRLKVGIDEWRRIRREATAARDLAMLAAVAASQ